jgi:hypothetical protein
MRFHGTAVLLFVATDSLSLRYVVHATCIVLYLMVFPVMMSLFWNIYIGGRSNRKHLPWPCSETLSKSNFGRAGWKVWLLLCWLSCSKQRRWWHFHTHPIKHSRVTFAAIACCFSDGHREPAEALGISNSPENPIYILRTDFHPKCKPIQLFWGLRPLALPTTFLTS